MFAIRFGVALLVFLATHYLLYWLIFGQILPISIATIASVGVATLSAVFTFQALTSAGNDVLRTASTWAMVTGAVGFCGGFFGPMIFAPEANQGPMLGLFITGPGGFVLGGIVGLCVGLARQRRSSETAQDGTSRAQ